MRKHVINLLAMILAMTMMYCAKKQTASTATTTPDANSAQMSEVAPNLGMYVGRYKMNIDELDAIEITMENNQLYGTASGQPKRRIQYESKDTFTVADLSNVKLTFKRNTNQEITGLTLFYEGQEITGEKVE